MHLMSRYEVNRCAACVFALLFGAALAQQGTTEVRGRVLDSQGAVLPGRHRHGAEPGHGHVPRDGPNDDGTFIVSGIVPGRYEIAAELQGFKKFTRRDMQLEVGKTATVDIPLEVGGRRNR